MARRSTAQSQRKENGINLNVTLDSMNIDAYTARRLVAEMLTDDYQLYEVGRKAKVAKAFKEDLEADRNQWAIVSNNIGVVDSLPWPLVEEFVNVALGVEGNTLTLKGNQLNSLYFSLEERDVGEFTNLIEAAKYPALRLVAKKMLAHYRSDLDKIAAERKREEEEAARREKEREQRREQEREQMMQRSAAEHVANLRRLGYTVTPPASGKFEPIQTKPASSATKAAPAKPTPAKRARA